MDLGRKSEPTNNSGQKVKVLCDSEFVLFRAGRSSEYCISTKLQGTSFSTRNQRTKNTEEQTYYFALKNI